MHGTAEIDGDDAIHVVGRIVDERLDVVPARRIDQNIDARMLREHGCRRTTDGDLIGEIDCDELDREVGLLRLFFNLRAFSFIYVGADDDCSATR